MMDHLSPGVEALVELEHKTIVASYGWGKQNGQWGKAWRGEDFV